MVPASFCHESVGPPERKSRINSRIVSDTRMVALTAISSRSWSRTSLRSTFVHRDIAQTRYVAHFLVS